VKEEQEQGKEEREREEREEREEDFIRVQTVFKPYSNPELNCATLTCS
jgi:hypothetical protein